MKMMAETPASSKRLANAIAVRVELSPQPSTATTLTRLGARISAANVAFDDHPNEKRFADRIETVTVDSVFSWMERSGLSGRLQGVR